MSMNLQQLGAGQKVIVTNLARQILVQSLEDNRVEKLRWILSQINTGRSDEQKARFPANAIEQMAFFARQAPRFKSDGEIIDFLQDLASPVLAPDAVIEEDFAVPPPGTVVAEAGKSPRVVISVSGGVAELAECTAADVEIVIRDYDILEGDIEFSERVYLPGDPPIPLDPTFVAGELQEFVVQFVDNMGNLSRYMCLARNAEHAVDQCKVDNPCHCGIKTVSISDAQAVKNDTGENCPFCDATDDMIEFGSVEFGQTECSQRAACENCGRQWHDIYKLTRIEPVPLDEPQPTIPINGCVDDGCPICEMMKTSKMNEPAVEIATEIKDPGGVQTTAGFLRFESMTRTPVYKCFTATMGTEADYSSGRNGYMAAGRHCFENPSQHTRGDFIHWLKWNEPSRVYEDDERKEDGQEPLTHKTAWQRLAECFEGE